MVRAERKPRTAQAAAGDGTLRESARSGGMLGLIAALVVTVGVTATVYWPVLGSRGLCFDDTEYVGKNKLVQQPGWPTVGRFFGEVLEPSSVGGYYQPLLGCVPSFRRVPPVAEQHDGRVRRSG